MRRIGNGGGGDGSGICLLEPAVQVALAWFLHKPVLTAPARAHQARVDSGLRRNDGFTENDGFTGDGGFAGDDFLRRGNGYSGWERGFRATIGRLDFRLTVAARCRLRESLSAPGCC